MTKWVLTDEWQKIIDLQENQLFLKKICMYEMNDFVFAEGLISQDIYRKVKTKTNKINKV